MIQLPITRQNILEFGFVKYDIYDQNEPAPITLVKIVPDNTATIKEIKVMLMQKLQIDVDKFDLVIASLSKGKIFQRYADSIQAQDLNPKIWILAFQIPKVQENEVLLEINFFSTKKTTFKNKKSTEIDALTEATPRLINVNKRDTIQALKATILSQLKPLFPNQDDQTSFDQLMDLRITQNLPVEQVGKYGANRQVVCDFCKERHDSS